MVVLWGNAANFGVYTVSVIAVGAIGIRKSRVITKQPKMTGTFLKTKCGEGIQGKEWEVDERVFGIL